ncbi:MULTISPECIES: hypothetical protein [Bacillus]|uniref:hypothetical protein n=1 Tax=Bacillus TaxID=1386 RepID=UPI000BF5440E|nr:MULTISPECIES: hypothetical protein [Bacillus]PFB54613.1 hypothetical protein CN404_08905 [Bacillus thuringiensis]PYE89395.1 hypothetical protein ATL10_103621 [Bacillus sp. 196mf]
MREERILLFVEQDIKEAFERCGISLSAVQEKIIKSTVQLTNDRHLNILEQYAYKLKKAERPS